MPTSQKLTARSVIDYMPAQLSAGKCWFIYFYAKKPGENKLSRVRIKVNKIKNQKQRRIFANKLMQDINLKLAEGWNPFIQAETPKAQKKLFEVFDVFITIMQRQLKDGIIRLETYNGYYSRINNIKEFLTENKLQNMYIYQFDKQFINKYLDYVYLEKNRTAKTRDNYLAFLRLFSTFLVEHDYLKNKPTDGINTLGKKIIVDKNRSVIPKELLNNIFEYLYNHNKHYLLACYVLYYAFIRPKEMAGLKVGDIKIENNTIYISASISKNKKRGHDGYIYT